MKTVIVNHILPSTDTDIKQVSKYNIDDTKLYDSGVIEVALSYFNKDGYAGHPIESIEVK